MSLELPFTKSDQIEVVNHPYTAENWMWFYYDVARADIAIYPFSININILSAFACPTKEILKQAIPDVGHNKQFIRKYDIHTCLYRLGLIEKISHSEFEYTKTAQVYELTVMGRSALETLNQGYVWTSRRGMDKLATTQFWNEIIRIDLDYPAFVKTSVATARVGISYTQREDEVPMMELQRLAQHTRMQLHEQGRGFVQKLVLHKLVN
ncbi:hypothetical protein D3C87_737230 [compost metagenome]